VPDGKPKQAKGADAELKVELLAAPYAALGRRARTEQAHSLVDHLFEMVVGGQAKQGRGDYQKTKLQKRRAVEGLAGDLLLAQSHTKAKGWVFRSLRTASFTGEDVGYRSFTPVIKQLTALGLAEHKVGFQTWLEGFDEGGPKLPHRRFAPRFRATPKLLLLSERHGVPIAQAKDHFILELPTKPLQRRTRTTKAYNGDKIKGRSMKIDPTSQTKALEADVRELNLFFDGFELRGGTHRGFIRIFNQGDDPDFDWNKGGRLYSHGRDNYQSMSSEERRLMTIGGERVCEIDIRASYLTIFHSWFDEQLDLSIDRDPYSLPGLGQEARGVVKLWFVATFGSAGHLTRWPADISSDYHKETKGQKLGKDYPIKLIREKAIQAFPLLASWGERKNGWADLMFVESAAMVATMIDLMRDHSVPSLSVHDSLIVPASKQQLAEKRLTAQYHWATGVEPTLVTV
jgi:hypothetical protein